MHTFSIEEHALSKSDILAERRNTERELKDKEAIMDRTLLGLFLSVASIFLVLVVTLNIMVSIFKIMGIDFETELVKSSIVYGASETSYLLFNIACIGVVALLQKIDHSRWSASYKKFDEETKLLKRYLESLNDITPHVYNEMLTWMELPEINAYRDEVVKNDRPFIQAEYSMLRDYYKKRKEEELCTALYRQLNQI